MKPIQQTPAWGGRNAYGCPFPKLDLRAQVAVLVKELGRHHLHRDKSVGWRTQRAREKLAYQFFEQLAEEGYKVQTMLTLKQIHVTALLLRWEAEEKASSTIQTRMSLLRWMCEALGKNGMVREPAFYGLRPETVARTYVATEDKSWTAKGIELQPLIEKLAQFDGWCGIQLRMMGAFGLRMSEAILMKPRASDQGDSLRVEEGTKGGRTRVVQIRTPEQREVLELAKDFAKESAKGNLVQPAMTPSQARRRFFYVCQKFGITKAQLGITSHGLRHQRANDTYEQIAGVPSAVRGGKPPEREVDLEARHQVTRDLGHARVSITAAYTGARRRGRPSAAKVSAIQKPLPF